MSSLLNLLSKTADLSEIGGVLLFEAKVGDFIVSTALPPIQCVDMVPLNIERNFETTITDTKFNKNIGYKEVSHTLAQADAAHAEAMAYAMNRGDLDEDSIG